MAGKLTPELVMAEVETVMSVRWEWGRADCCTSASDVFLALHGIDPMAEFRGLYDSAISAARLIQNWGDFPAMAEALARASGLSPSDGDTGDIGLSSPGAAGGPDGRAMLICISPGIWAGKSELGYTILPNAERCWHA